MTDTASDRDYIQSIERGFTVLRAFDAERTNPSLAEIAAATGLARPVVRRILLTLQRLGYVTSDSRRWSLTPAVLSIGQHYTASHNIIETAQPQLLRLAEQTQESASLAALNGAEVVYIARVAVRRIMSSNVFVGSRVPAHATSMGRTLLAWAPDTVVEQVIEDGLRAVTPYTLTDPVRFRAELRTVRSQGWALVADELEVGLVSVSAPVRDENDEVIAALASSSSSGRSSVEHLRTDVVPLLLRTAREISSSLGYGGRKATFTTTYHEGFF